MSNTVSPGVNSILSRISSSFSSGIAFVMFFLLSILPLYTRCFRPVLGLLSDSSGLILFLCLLVLMLSLSPFLHLVLALRRTLVHLLLELSVLWLLFRLTLQLLDCLLYCQGLLYLCRLLLLLVLVMWLFALILYVVPGVARIFMRGTSVPGACVFLQMYERLCVLLS